MKLPSKLPSKDNIYAVVKQKIDEYDFMQLLSLNCPKDEYDPEIREIGDGIVTILRKRKRKGMKIHLSVRRLNELIFHTFICYFAKYEDRIDDEIYSSLYSQASLFLRASAEICYDLNNL